MLLFNLLMMSGWAYILISTVVAALTSALENGQVSLCEYTPKRYRYVAAAVRAWRETSTGLGSEFLSYRSRRHEPHQHLQQQHTYRNCSRRHSRSHVANYQHVRNFPRGI
jgi:ribosomal protein S13